jgi:hypothetical protein
MWTARSAMISRQIRRLTRGIAGVNLATLIRLIRFGPRDAARRVSASFQAADPFGSRSVNEVMFDRVPAVSIRSLVSGQLQVDVDPGFIATDGALPDYQLRCLLALARHESPQAVLEIGTFCGSTTLNLARNLPAAKIHTVDLPPNYAVNPAADVLPKDDFHLIESRRLGSAFAGTAQASRITQHLGDTATYDFGKIPDPITFFFIDGSHTYEYARSDTLRCMEIARGRSTFLWHDCDTGHPGVLKWLAEMIDAGFPVSRIAHTSIAHAKIDPSSEETKLRLQKLQTC